MKKLIYLEDAIEAIKDADVLVFYDTGTDTDDACELAIRATKGAIIEELNVLPSAEPEIIRCRDCEHWDKSWANDWEPNCHYCPMIDRVCGENWYCAGAERRTADGEEVY